MNKSMTFYLITHSGMWCSETLTDKGVLLGQIFEFPDNTGDYQEFVLLYTKKPRGKYEITHRWIAKTMLRSQEDE